MRCANIHPTSSACYYLFNFLLFCVTQIHVYYFFLYTHQSDLLGSLCIGVRDQPRSYIFQNAGVGMRDLLSKVVTGIKRQQQLAFDPDVSPARPYTDKNKLFWVVDN